ncbi:MAG: radical SAM protein [Candidatus Zambryskibacteria bacterium]
MKKHEFKILFVHPNDYLSIGIPSGIATLSAILKKGGYNVGLFDFTFVKTQKTEQEPKRANAGIYLKTEYSIEDLVANDPVQSLEKAFKKKLSEFKPDLIAISVMTGQFDKVIDLLKKVKPNCKIVVGGVHATLCPEDVLKFKEIDFACVGEGEELILELCECLEKHKDYSNLKNLGFRKRGKIQINECRPFVDMDKLPIPDWSLFDERHLFRPFMGKIYSGSFYTMSRGCPQLCTYCVNGSLRKTLKDCGRYFRFQSPKTTIKQLTYLKEKFGATWFKFADDSIMLLSEEYLEELAGGLAPLHIKFGCSVRPETTTVKKVQLLKKMGCVAASVGVESGNEKLRRGILNRTMTNDQIKNAIKLLNTENIRVSTFNMIGLPNESRKNVFETIRLNKELDVEAANVYIIYPYPKTVISEKHEIKLRDGNSRIIPVSKASSFNFSKMPPLEVEGLLKTFDLYLKMPEKIWPQIKMAEGRTKKANNLRSKLYSQALTK